MVNRNVKRLDILEWVVGILLSMACSFIVLLNYIDMPIVKVNPVTGKCISVDTPPNRPKLSCDDIKGMRYHSEYVLPHHEHKG